jgi:hypothetical protein
VANQPKKSPLRAVISSGKKKAVISISIETCSGGNYCYCGTLRCLGIYYSAAYRVGDSLEDALEQDEEDCATGSNLRRLVAQMADTAYLDGFREVHRVEYRYRDTVCWKAKLRKTAGRERMVQAALEAEKQRKRAARAEARRLKPWRDLSETLRSPTRESISRFATQWRKVTGYGPKDLAVREALVPGKEAGPVGAQAGEGGGLDLWLPTRSECAKPLPACTVRGYSWGAGIIPSAQCRGFSRI